MCSDIIPMMTPSGFIIFFFILKNKRDDNDNLIQRLLKWKGTGVPGPFPGELRTNTKLDRLWIV